MTPEEIQSFKYGLYEPLDPMYGILYIIFFIIIFYLIVKNCRD